MAQRSKSLGAPSRQAILGTAREKLQVQDSSPSVKIFDFASSLIRGAFLTLSFRIVNLSQSKTDGVNLARQVLNYGYDYPTIHNKFCQIS